MSKPIGPGLGPPSRITNTSSPITSCTPYVKALKGTGKDPLLTLARLEQFFPSLPGQIGGERGPTVEVYIDSMAGNNFISRGLLREIEAATGQRFPLSRGGEYQPGHGSAFRTQRVELPVAFMTGQLGLAPVRHNLGKLSFEVCDLQAVSCLLGAPFLNDPERDSMMSWGVVKFLSININGRRENLPLTVLDASRPNISCDIEARDDQPILLMVQPTFEGTDKMVSENLVATESISLSQEQQVRLTKLLDAYPSVFSDVWDTEDGLPPERWPGNVCDLQIKAGASDDLPHQKPFPLSDAMREEARKLIESLVEKGLLEPITEAAFASPIFLVGKRNERGEHSGYRLVVDYRALNGVTRSNVFPLPRCDSLTHQMARGCVHSSADLKDGFYQVKNTPRAKGLSAVTTPFGLYAWRAMPMGIAQGPSIFSSMVSRIFDTPAFRDFLTVYIDDLGIHSPSIEAHFTHLEKVLVACQQNRLKIKRQKLHCFCRSITFLGRKVTNGRIGVAAKHSKLFQNWKTPTDGHQIARLLGMANWYRPHIKHYATMVAPLEKLKSKHLSPQKQNGTAWFQRNSRPKEPWEWLPEHDKAFKELLKTLGELPDVQAFDPLKRHRVFTDASTEGGGGVLEQLVEAPSDTPQGEGQWLPVSFWSRKWSSTETRYPMHCLELLSVVESLECFQLFIMGSQFEVYCDNRAACYFLSKHPKQLSPREQRTLWRLSRFLPLELRFIRGEDNIVADALSRDVASREWHLLDFCSGGSCSMLTSISRHWRANKADVDAIYYQPVESCPEARAVLDILADQLRREGMPLMGNIWEFSEMVGHDVKMMTVMAMHGHSGVLETLSQADLVFGGPPCQPWSRAGLQAGFQDSRDVWSSLIQLHGDMRTRGLDMAFTYECSMDTSNPAIAEAKRQIDEALGVEGRKVTVEYGQRRERWIWTSFTDMDFTDMEKATWADRLQAAAGTRRAATPSLDSQGKPRKLAPALTASTDTYSEADGRAHVYDIGKSKARSMTKAERAAVVGVDPGPFHGLSKETWWRLLGNAVPRPLTDVICRHVLGENMTLRYSGLGESEQGKGMDGVSAGEAEAEDPVTVRVGEAPTFKTGRTSVKKRTPNPTGESVEAEPGTMAMPILVLGPSDADEKLLGLTKELTSALHVQQLHPGGSSLRELAERRANERGIKLPKRLLDIAVKNTIAGCTVCRLTKSPRVEAWRRAMPFSTSGEPMRDIELDEAEMPESEDGYNGFLTIVDRLTGYTSTYLIRKSDTTGDMIRILETLCYREGFPDTISTDEGSRWRSKEFKSWCEERGIQLEEAVPHHHQRQGKVERTHGLLKRALRAGLRDEANIQKYYDPRIWSSILPAATAHVNDMPRCHGVNMPSRNQMYLGRNVPCDGLRPPRSGSGRITDIAWAEWKEYILSVLQEAHARKVASQPLKKEQGLKVGDRVFGIRRLDTSGPQGSMNDKTRGPYRVTAVKANDAYEIQDEDGKICTRHRRHLVLSGEDETLGSADKDVEKVLDEISIALDPGKTSEDTSLWGERNQWTTCEGVLRKVEDLAGERIAHDLCGSPERHVHASFSTNALEYLEGTAVGKGLHFCNPPYLPESEALKLVRDICTAAEKQGVRIAFVLPVWLSKKVGNLTVLHRYKQGTKGVFRGKKDELKIPWEVTISVNGVSNQKEEGNAYIRHYLLITRKNVNEKAVANCVYGLDADGQDMIGIENFQINLRTDGRDILEYSNDWGPIPLRGIAEGLAFPTIPYRYDLSPRQICRRNVTLRSDVGRSIPQFEKFGISSSKKFSVKDLTLFKLKGFEGCLEDRRETRLASRLRERAVVAAPRTCAAEAGEGSVVVPG